MAPLAPRDHYADAISGLVDRRATRYALSSNGVSSAQNCQALGPGEDVANEADLDFAQHYGFVSRPPADTELVTVPGNPVDVSVAEMADLPSGLSAVGTGESALYDSSGNYLWLKASGGADLKTAAGSVRVTVPGGSAVKLSAGGATVKAAAQGHAVTAATTMAAWIAKVQAVCVAIDPTIVAPTDFGTISGGSNVVEIEV